MLEQKYYYQLPGPLISEKRGTEKQYIEGNDTVSSDSGTQIQEASLELSQSPRQQLEQFGAKLMTTADLLSVVTNPEAKQPDQALVDLLAFKISNLRALNDLTCHQLVEQCPTISIQQAVQISAAIELGRRMMTAHEEKPQIGSPTDVARLMMPELRALQKEVLLVLCLDTKNKVIAKRQIFEGSLNASIVHPREVFRFAIEQSAASIILVHNHPSGDPKPSSEDIRTTKQLRKAGEYIQIPVLDHVIIGDRDYTSLKEADLV